MEFEQTMPSPLFSFKGVGLPITFIFQIWVEKLLVSLFYLLLASQAATTGGDDSHHPAMPGTARRAVQHPR